MNWAVDRHILANIGTLLLSLAMLADRASRLPLLRRLQVLDIIAYGEAEARVLVTGTTSGDPNAVVLEFDDPAPLAAQLRILALVVMTILHVTRPRTTIFRIDRRSLRLRARFEDTVPLDSS